MENQNKTAAAELPFTPVAVTEKGAVPATTKVIESAEVSLETEETGLLKSPTSKALDDLLRLSENADKMIEAYNKIRMSLLKLAQEGDWVVFKGDKEGDQPKAELGWAGAERISTTIGVRFENWERRKLEGQDEYGKWYRWEFECDAIYGNRMVRVYGRAGTRTKFFGRKGGAFKALRDIPEDDIMIAAWRGAMKEGVRSLFGLHRMNPEFLKKYNVTLTEAKVYEFKKDKADPNAPPADAETVNVTVIETKSQKGKSKAGKEYTKYYVHDNEGVIYQTFDEKLHAKVVEEMKKGGTVTLSFKQTQYGCELVSVGSSEAAGA